MGRTLQFAVVLCSVLAIVAVAAITWRSARARLRTTRTAESQSEAVRDTDAERTPTPESSRPSEDSAPSQQLPDVLIDPAILIEKSTRTLTLLSADEPVTRYPVAFGSQPIGDKEREGDGRTPEGLFYVCVKNPASRYHRSLGLSYPAEEDADRGLASGLIDKRDHRAIVSAIHRMERPPWRTALGGEIAIHGGGAGRGDWTEGCVALEDEAAEELFDALPLGTPVEIRP